MGGFLKSNRFGVAEQRIGEGLHRVDPIHHSIRRNLATNPMFYKADYFGQKCHTDQNEKVVMYGTTHVCVIDGFTGKIIGFVSMPIKSKLMKSSMINCIGECNIDQCGATSIKHPLLHTYTSFLL